MIDGAQPAPTGPTLTLLDADVRPENDDAVQRMAFVLADMMALPKVRDSTKVARGFLLSAIALIKLSWGKDAALRIKLLCKEAVTQEDMYRVLTDSHLDNATVLVVSLYLTERMRWVSDGGASGYQHRAE